MRITKPRNYQYMSNEEKQKWADDMTKQIKVAREKFHAQVEKLVDKAEGGENMEDQTQAVDPITTPENIKALRVEIDAVKQKVKAMADRRPPKGGAELTLSFRALQQAKHWLGEALGELGVELPAQYADKAQM